MRSRFALLVAAAVIFAPGWDGHGPPQHPRGSDLTARVLAPTVDEGAIRSAAAELKDQLSGRHAKRWRPGLTVEVITTSGVDPLALVIIWVVTSYCGPFFGLNRVRFLSSRAPPRFQPA
jgi:hypothetical protein